MKANCIRYFSHWYSRISQSLENGWFSTRSKKYADAGLLTFRRPPEKHIYIPYDRIIQNDTVPLRYLSPRTITAKGHCRDILVHVVEIATSPMIDVEV